MLFKAKKYLCRCTNGGEAFYMTTQNAENGQRWRSCELVQSSSKQV